MKFYDINIENGRNVHGDFYSYTDALNYAVSCANGHNFTIEEYDSEEDFFASLS